MLYLVKIGRTSRRGGFQELHSVPVETLAIRDDIVDYYRNQYKGFEVTVTEFTKIEKPDFEPREAGFITDLRVKHTEEEQKIAQEYEEKCNECDALLEQLHSRIRQRYATIDFVDHSDYHGGITKLETNKYGCTYIRKLYINSYIFIQHMGEGKEI